MLIKKWRPQKFSITKFSDSNWEILELASFLIKTLLLSDVFLTNPSNLLKVLTIDWPKSVAVILKDSGNSLLERGT